MGGWSSGIPDPSRFHEDGHVLVRAADGRVYKRPYRYLRTDGYVTTWRRGRKELEHRVVGEEMVGRPLLDEEQVHHKNKIRHDNRPENLEVVSTEEHAAEHNLPCPPGCECAKHRPYERDAAHRARMSAAMQLAWQRRRGEQ